MAEFYSRPLSPTARRKLIGFIQAYTESMTVTDVDEKAEIAKTKAIEVLQTDIDILVFVVALVSFYKEAASLVEEVRKGRINPRKVAELIVEITEKSRQLDMSGRPSGN
jgi:hypothetical protein